MKPQKLPIGIQTFSEIIKEDYLYVDKTKKIYELISTGKTYFLSRPRRFGKSLLISTLEEIYKGNKELFKGLDIYKEDYSWESHPIVRIDFSKINKDSLSLLKTDLSITLQIIAKEHGIDSLDKNLEVTIYFKLLIKELSQINKVTILIDEYDAPIIKHLGKDKELAIKMREFLKNFYTIIKGEDEYIKFVLLTGVSKFSKVGVFSGLNNLQDITMTTQYADLVGWSQKELEDKFPDYIKELAKKEEISKKEVIEKIRHWYNGYQFSSEGEKQVYNPFSNLLLFKQQQFKFHWFETGTPTFLVNLVKEKNSSLPIEETISLKVTEEAFSSYEIEDLSPAALLFQTGYLTIEKASNTDFGIQYSLDFPNFEVKRAFGNALLSSFSQIKNILTPSYLDRLLGSLKEKDFETFFETLRIFFANIPYDIHLSNEKYYQTIFYLVFTLLGLKTQVEVRTNKGRIDAVVEVDERWEMRDRGWNTAASQEVCHSEEQSDEESLVGNGTDDSAKRSFAPLKMTGPVFIFEFKLQGTKEEALNQIKEKKYYEKYMLPSLETPQRGASTNLLAGNKVNTNENSTDPTLQTTQLFLIGVEFDQKERNIGEWVVERFRP